MRRFFLLSCMLVTLSSCYRMPAEGDYCVIPTTNNPDVTRHREGVMPSMNY